MAPPTKPQGGRNANLAGQNGEQLIRGLLEGHGLRQLYESEYREIKARLANGERIMKLMPIDTYAEQLPAFTSIYHRAYKPDFIWRTATSIGVIEKKWQSSQGSVDQKYPYAMLTMERIYRLLTEPDEHVDTGVIAPDLTHDVHSVFVLLGDGASGGAIEWLKERGAYSAVDICLNANEVQKLLTRVL